ncbi:MAG: protein kinase, partial [Verrucomicrobiota bacterium]
MISESQTSSCAACGSPIPSDAPGGWCPACLLRNLLGGGPDQDEAKAKDVLDVRDMIGPYRLLEEIGEGGFGVVWRAEQTDPIRREVALKLVKPGMDSREIVRRFEAERRTLALMEHPNIAA